MIDTLTQLVKIQSANVIDAIKITNKKPFDIDYFGLTVCADGTGTIRPKDKDKSLFNHVTTSLKIALMLLKTRHARTHTHTHTHKFKLNRTRLPSRTEDTDKKKLGTMTESL